MGLGHLFKKFTQHPKVLGKMYYSFVAIQLILGNKVKKEGFF